VYAALRAGRRTSYKLYLHTRGVARDEAAQEQASVRSIAAKSGIKIIQGDTVDVRLLDKMSGGRPHNVRFELHVRKWQHLMCTRALCSRHHHCLSHLSTA
jgi:hypothetical protein